MQGTTRSTVLAATLLAAATALAGVNWYLQPQRAVAWGAALAFLGVMAVALLGPPAFRAPPRSHAPPRPCAAASPSAPSSWSARWA